MDAKEHKDRVTESMLSDVMTEKPIRFAVHDDRTKSPYKCLPPLRQLRDGVRADTVREFEVRPPTLGKMQLLSQCYLALGFDQRALQEEPAREAMRVCERDMDTVCRLMAVAVSDTKEELTDEDRLTDLADFFRWHASPEDFSRVVLAVLVQVRYENFTNSIALTRLLRQNEPPHGEPDAVE